MIFRRGRMMRSGATVSASESLRISTLKFHVAPILCNGVSGVGRRYTIVEGALFTMKALYSTERCEAGFVMTGSEWVATG
jgi:hypothetical protein